MCRYQKVNDEVLRRTRLVEACQYSDNGVVVAESLHHLDVCPMAPVHCFECEESYLRNAAPRGVPGHARGVRVPRKRVHTRHAARRDVGAHEDLAGLHAVWALKRVKSLRAKVKVVQREHAADVAAALELARRLERRVDVLSQKVAAAQEPAVLRTQPQEGDPFVTSGECVAKPSGGTPYIYLFICFFVEKMCFLLLFFFLPHSLSRVLCGFACVVLP